MKKLFLLFAALLLSNMLVMGQNSKVSCNVTAGINMSNWTGSNSSGLDAKLGFKVGAGMEYAFNNTWAIQHALFLTTKGTKYSETIEGASADVTVNEIYLELPVNLQARMPIADKMNFLIAAGPYIAYGIGGKTKTKVTVENLGGSFDTNTFGNGGLKRFDAGVGLGVSLEINKIILGIDGQLGLLKLDDGDAPKNINFSATIGYKF
ncbi:porin family protein [uncultured Bacteroides sp.]|uniref:porin family protein n=1 Tax=uncultured Bacteroides sp. TaxID=162156 RepID=UPI002AAA7667|nr:porin family protein [uncultured Bacteroides sp.]